MYKRQAQIFGVEQLILRKQFFAEMEAVLPQEVTAVELVAGTAIVEGVWLLDQMLCVLLSGVHPGRQIAICLLYTSQMAKAVYEGAQAGTEAAKALRKG